MLRVLGYGLTSKFLAFARVGKSARPTRDFSEDPLVLWSHIEAIAIFLDGDLRPLHGEFQHHI